MATIDGDKILDYRHPEAKRNNNPLAGLTAQGKADEAPVLKYAYTPSTCRPPSASTRPAWPTPMTTSWKPPGSAPCRRGGRPVSRLPPHP